MGGIDLPIASTLGVDNGFDEADPDLEAPESDDDFDETADVEALEIVEEDEV